MRLVPYLHFEGNAEEVLNFYADALEGKILFIQRYGDSPMPCDEDYRQKIMHGRLGFGDNLLMISDSFKGHAVQKGDNIQMSVEVEDISKMDDIFNKMAEGGTKTMELQDTFWGARFGMLRDKFGINWMFNHEYKKEEQHNA